MVIHCLYPATVNDKYIDNRLKNVHEIIPREIIMGFKTLESFQFFLSVPSWCINQIRIYRPGAHGAVGAALATPTFGSKMGMSDVIVHLFIVVLNHCMNSLCTIINRL